MLSEPGFSGFEDEQDWGDALTEYYNAKNGASLACVYTSDSGYNNPIRTSTDTASIDLTQGSEDNPYVNASATGFRLPTTAEWSCAARYKGTDSSNGAYEWPVSSGDWWMPGDYVSGDIEDYLSSSTYGDYAWYKFNSGPATNDVKTKLANSLGVHDMSGNVIEWNFDWHPDYDESRRTTRSGQYNSLAGDLQVGKWMSLDPYMSFSSIGLRIAKTQ